MGRRIFTSMFNFGLSNVMTRIIGFLLIPVYTQYLNPEDYGILELCSSFAAFIIILMRLGVPGAVNRFYFDYRHEPKRLNDYVTTVHHLLVFSSICLGIIVGLVLYAYGDLVLSGVMFFPFIFLTLINAGFSANSDLQKRLLQSKEDSAYLAKLNLSLALLGIALALLFVVYFEMGALGLMMSQSITTLIFFVQAQYYLRNYLAGSFNWSMFKESMKYGMGLLPHHLFAVLAPLLSKVILNSFGSLSSLGLFSLALRFIAPLDIIYTVFNQSFNPIYFSLRKNGDDQQIGKVYNLVWIVALCLFMITALIAPPVILLITPIRYHESAVLVPILAIGFIGQVAYLLFVQESFYVKKTKNISLITGLGLLLNLLITILFVKNYGVFSIAWAYACGFITWGIVGFFVSNKQFIKYIKFQNILFGFLFVIIVFLFSVFTDLNSIYIRLVVFFSALLVASLTYILRNKKRI
jgi:O-antigen/teichoic acid export membrane protein